MGAAEDHSRTTEPKAPMPPPLAPPLHSCNPPFSPKPSSFFLVLDPQVFVKCWLARCLPVSISLPVCHHSHFTDENLEVRTTPRRGSTSTHPRHQLLPHPINVFQPASLTETPLISRTFKPVHSSRLLISAPTTPLLDLTSPTLRPPSCPSRRIYMPAAL